MQGTRSINERGILITSKLQGGKLLSVALKKHEARRILMSNRSKQIPYDSCGESLKQRGRKQRLLGPEVLSWD